MKFTFIYLIVIFRYSISVDILPLNSNNTDNTILTVMRGENFESVIAKDQCLTLRVFSNYRNTNLEFNLSDISKLIISPNKPLSVMCNEYDQYCLELINPTIFTYMNKLCTTYIYISICALNDKEGFISLQTSINKEIRRCIPLENNEFSECASRGSSCVDEATCTSECEYLKCKNGLNELSFCVPSFVDKPTICEETLNTSNYIVRECLKSIAEEKQNKKLKILLLVIIYLLVILLIMSLYYRIRLKISGYPPFEFYYLPKLLFPKKNKKKQNLA